LVFRRLSFHRAHIKASTETSVIRGAMPLASFPIAFEYGA